MQRRYRLLEVVTGSVMADRNDERLSPRASGGSGAPSIADFSTFREMIREEREAARAEREAAAAERLEWSVRRLLRSSGV